MPRHPRSRCDLLASLLAQTSPSFAQSIPAAPAPLDHEMTVALLLRRIAETFADGTGVSIQQRRRGLAATIAAVVDPECPDARAVLREEVRAVAQSELMASTDAVLDALVSLQSDAAEVIARHTVRAAEAGFDWVGRIDGDGRLPLQGYREVRTYCDSVAEMLCELFVRGCAELPRVQDEAQPQTRAAANCPDNARVRARRSSSQ